MRNDGQSDEDQTNTDVRTAIVRLFAIVAAVLVLIVSMASWSGVTSRSQAVAEEPVQLVSYTVQPGDTLWSYAEKITPQGGDVSENVNRLIAINGLDSTWLEPGQKLQVPVR